MRCTTYCSASSYDIQALYQDLKQEEKAQLYRNVVHVQRKDGARIKGEIFYFAYGVVVCWGLTEEEEQVLLLSLKTYEDETFTTVEMDEFTFSYGENMWIEEDHITLQNKNVLNKLAISHGLAQSVKLAILEDKIRKIIDRTNKLPSDLAKKGKILLSRKEISRKMGALFLERNYINLNTEILETPEFFWDHSELEPFYRRTAHYLEIGKRGEGLNKRLAIVHELFQILSNEINHQHATRLEWTIIVLILIEVVLALLRDLFHLI